MASSSSSTTSRRRRRVVVIRHPSREDEYEEPTRFCHHGLPAPRWTSWSDANPGRRFYGCRYYKKSDACHYFSWHDEEFGERPNTVIKDLLDDIDKLYDENCNFRKAENVEKTKELLDDIGVEMKKMKRKIDTYAGQEKNGEMKFRIVLCLLVVTYICLVLMYM